jgi:HlyD family secretion protein
MANTRKFDRKRTIIGAAVFVAVILGWWFYHSKTSRAALGGGGEIAYTVARKDMTISVMESGSVKASNAVTIRSAVEGRTIIVNIVPEGTILTAEDVANGKIILELDISSLKENLTQQQIEYNTAMADFTDAKENLDIQKNQNESDVQQAWLTVKFALMDLQKYLGQSAADKLIADANSRSVTDEDFKKLTLDPNQLGGESLQKHRQLTSDINMAQSECYLAQNTLTWTEKLAAKNYVAKTELESDKLKADKSKITLEQAQTAIDLFVRYEFPKDAHKFFSDYVEAKRQLERTQAKARSLQAQAEAKLSSAEAKFSLEKERLERLKRQIAASSVRAPRPGMVVYATQGGGRPGSSRGRTSIEVGREVMEREEIMSIPSASEMAVDTKIHETNIDKVTVGQRARIMLDAMPDKVFYGSVLKIAPLPDPAAFMSNPDLKVYSTDVSLESSETLRPGMSAKVEVIIAQLKNVIAVPVQCISNRGGKKICFVQTRTGGEERQVKTGPYNDKFIQILEGLNEGDKVLLNPPRVFDQPQERPIPNASPSVSTETQSQPGSPPNGQADSQRPRRMRPDGQSPTDGQQPDGQTDSQRPRRQRTDGQTDSQRPRQMRPDGQSPTDGQQPDGQAGSQRPRRQRPDGQSPTDGQQPAGQTDSQRPQRQQPGGGDSSANIPAKEPQQ